jgi:D-lactate dehydrogenase (cytochrome)
VATRSADDAPASALPTALHQALAALLGDRLSVSPSLRAQYGRGESYPHLHAPDAVAFPVSTTEVGQIVAACHAHDVPMVASGTGTSLEGHIAAVRGGVAINLMRMDRIVEVNEEDLDCVVEAGVTREQLNHELRDRGLFFPIDPGANASLGGMAATRASGTNAVRYGTMMDNVLGLTVVQPDGRVIHTGTRARKSAAGYDLTRLYIGSEGTLGIITEVRLKLYGIPETMAAATCVFDDLAGAVTTVTQLIQLGVPVARIEFLDDVQVRACNAYSKLGLPEKPHLFFEFHGSKAATDEQARIAQDMAEANGGSHFAWATTTEDRSRLWKGRHNAYHAAVAMRPGATIWTSDVCVPVSHLPDAVLAVREDLDRHGLTAPIVGHVGDGNFHVLFAVDESKPGERERAEAVYERMIHRAIEVGGSCTGEHGIGLVKRTHLIEEHGEDAVETMRMIKRALDPKGLMNPGKIFL